MSHRSVVGCMTGTSLDGLDAALLRIDGVGLDLSARLTRARSTSLGPVAAPVRRLASGEPCTAAEIARATARLSDLHVELIRKLCGRRRPDLIAVHGQTVYHAPPLSWQLINPTLIAHKLRSPVVCDLRAADLAAGGQGAPITPLADYILFRDARERRAIVNLGGFCNVTFLPASAAPMPASACASGSGGSAGAAAAARSREVRRIRGGDVCVCNQLLDAIARRCFAAPFDRGGHHASSGSAHGRARADLQRRLKRQAAAGRSLGTGDELFAWIDRHVKSIGGPDLARTACEAIAETIAGQMPRVDRIILAGGGARSAALVDALRRRARVPLSFSDELGVPIVLREACGIAVLGALCADGVPITLPAVTGCRPAPLAGVWVRPAARA
jgi:1,6-anhydro-N-acetylmuramate kinase